MKKPIVLTILCLALQAQAAPTLDSNCTANILDINNPTIVPNNLYNDSIYFCKEGYASLYNTTYRTPLYSAEILTKERLLASKDMVRVNDFHEEPGLSSSPTNKEYARSGYDRGHLAPNADMSSRNSQYESFSFVNLIPQDPDNNRHLWANIESTTRKFTLKSGKAYVVSGVLFLNPTLKTIGSNGRNKGLYVPTHLWKAVYYPNSSVAGVYLVNNAPGNNYQILSLADFAKNYNFTPFPTLDNNIKQLKNLPTVEDKRNRY